MKYRLLELLLSGLQISALKEEQSVEVLLLNVAYHRIPLTTALAAVTVAFFGPLYYVYFFHNGFMLMWIALVRSNYCLSAMAYFLYSRQSLTQDNYAHMEPDFSGHKRLQGLVLVVWAGAPDTHPF